jgi:hypothetical protein
VEAGSNTSTVALRVVGGDEKETNAWGYNWATLFLGDIYIYIYIYIIYGDLALQMGGASNLRQ